MGRKKATSRNDNHPGPFDKARDELLSHILNCGVLKAQPVHQSDWFDDTMEYLAERYPVLSDRDLASLRELGERFCRPVVPHETSGSPPST